MNEAMDKAILKRKNRLEKLEGLWRNVENGKNMNSVWSAVDRFSLRKVRKEGSVENKEWPEHLRKLLGAESTDKTDKRQRVDSQKEEKREERQNKDITLIEVKRALDKIKNKKVTGNDEIAIEFLKELSIKWFIVKLVSILNELWYRRSG